MTYQPLLRGFEALFEPPAADASPDIRDYPDVSTEALTAHAKWVGAAGEALVDSLLLRSGIYTAQLPETLPADRLVYHAGRPLRLQVKSTTHPRRGGYTFNVLRGYHRAPSGVRGYAESDFDLLALVVLPENVAKFTAEKALSHRILHREIAPLRAQPLRSLDHALAALGIAPPEAVPDLHDTPTHP